MGPAPHFGPVRTDQSRGAGARSISGAGPMAGASTDRDPLCTDRDRKDSMRGTIVCGFSDSNDGRAALEAAAVLSERLRLRLVLAHVADGIGAPGGDVDGNESVTMKANREGSARLFQQLAADHGLSDRTERRSAFGDPAVLLGQIAAEEAADLIVVGARMRGRWRRRLESRLAEQLETETPVPVLIAAPRTGRRSLATNGGER
jgi:nucleotide-binding universal stress UspA family protein